MATAPAVRAGSSIEALFRPSNHYFRGRLPEGFTEELELLPGLTTENVLATGVTWGDFLRFLQGKFLWMAPDVYVIPRYVSGLAQSLVLGLGGYDIVTNMFVRVTEDTAAAAATATCDFLVRLLATCEERGVSINGCCNAVPLPLSGAALSLFLQESRDSLRKVTLYDMTLSEDQCRALATMSRLDVELDMYNCSLVDDAAGAFIECLQSDKGPIKLNGCEIDNQIIASALTGKSRVTRLELVPVNDTAHDVIFRVLANNRGLLDLDLQFNSISDENWTILCESLKAHPTLTSLHLQRTWPRSPTGGRIVPTDDQKTSRTHVVAEMMQHNTVLQSISLSGRERDEQIYTAEIIPYLETNRYRPRVHGITKADIPLRRALLGMALHTVSARKDTNLIWMFLSGNSDVVVQSNEES
jgi:hypothetical protein